MKHTTTLTTLAAAALAAAIPLAAQAQTTQTSQLSIVVGPEPTIEPTVTCSNAQPGKLIPFAYPGDHATRKGEVALFTTDIGEAGMPGGIAIQAADADKNGQEPGLTLGWTYGSSTATKYVQLKAKVPLATITNAINDQKTQTSTGTWATPASIATAGNGSSSHVFLKDVGSLAATGATVTQSWNGDTLTVDIKRGTDTTLTARANAFTKLDITLQAPAGLRLKEASTATTADIEWTCSLVAYPTTTGN